MLALRRHAPLSDGDTPEQNAEESIAVAFQTARDLRTRSILEMPARSLRTNPTPTPCEGSISQRSCLRFVLCNGVVVARLVGPQVTEPAQVDRLASSLNECIACGNERLVLDFQEVARISRKVLAEVGRAHRRIVAMGGA